MNVLTLTLYGGSGFPFQSRDAALNIFVKVIVDRKGQRSRLVQASASPVWNDEMDFPLERAPLKAEFEVILCEEGVPDERVGRGTLPLDLRGGEDQMAKVAVAIGQLDVGVRYTAARPRFLDARQLSSITEAQESARTGSLSAAGSLEEELDKMSLRVRQEAGGGASARGGSASARRAHFDSDEDAVVTIQRYARGFLARQQTRELKQLLADLEAEEEERRRVDAQRAAETLDALDAQRRQEQRILERNRSIVRSSSMVRDGVPDPAAPIAIEVAPPPDSRAALKGDISAELERRRSSSAAPRPAAGTDEAAVVTIQRFARGYMARQQTRELKQLLSDMEAEEAERRRVDEARAAETLKTLDAQRQEEEHFVERNLSLVRSLSMRKEAAEAAPPPPAAAAAPAAAPAGSGSGAWGGGSGRADRLAPVREDDGEERRPSRGPSPPPAKPAPAPAPAPARVPQPPAEAPPPSRARPPVAVAAEEEPRALTEAERRAAVRSVVAEQQRERAAAEAQRELEAQLARGEADLQAFRRTRSLKRLDDDDGPDTPERRRGAWDEDGSPVGRASGSPSSPEAEPPRPQARHAPPAAYREPEPPRPPARQPPAAPPPAVYEPPPQQSPPPRAASPPIAAPRPLRPQSARPPWDARGEQPDGGSRPRSASHPAREPGGAASPRLPVGGPGAAPAPRGSGASAVRAAGAVPGLPIGGRAAAGDGEAEWLRRRVQVLREENVRLQIVASQLQFALSLKERQLATEPSAPLVVPSADGRGSVLWDTPAAPLLTPSSEGEPHRLARPQLPLRAAAPMRAEGWADEEVEEAASRLALELEEARRTEQVLYDKLSRFAAQEVAMRDEIRRLSSQLAAERDRAAAERARFPPRAGGGPLASGTSFPPRSRPRVVGAVSGNGAAAANGRSKRY